ncbi:MAG: inositol monophosphatase [Actinomycetota bacterium]|nr:inositol monophosphatase [Actinomycetota bacterium]
MARSKEAELLALAEDAAAAAAAELTSRFGGGAQGVRSKSSPTDLVSDADVAAEAAIRSVISAAYPDDAIIGEEEGETGAGERCWVVDPLDGTINFLFGIPVFAVSIACEDRDGALAAIVLDPVREERFTATRSGAAALNGEPIAASERDDLASALVATGFAYEASVRARQAEVVSRVLPRVRDIRRAGAAALDLCWCACGRYDAYYERGVHAWDVAAGTLIAQRAGLTVRRLEAAGEDAQGLLAAPRAIVEELYRLVDGTGRGGA